MRLNLEIVLFSELYHPSDGSSFASVSTTLQNKISGCPSFNLKIVGLSVSHMGSNTQFNFTELQGSMSVMLLPWKQLSWTFQKKGNFTHSWPTCCLHNNGIFPEHVWHLSVVFQTLHMSGTHRGKYHLEIKYDIY